jgi:hypothetical protein
VLFRLLGCIVKFLSYEELCYLMCGEHEEEQKDEDDGYQDGED